MIGRPAGLRVSCLLAALSARANRSSPPALAKAGQGGRRLRPLQCSLVLQRLGEFLPPSATDLWRLSDRQDQIVRHGFRHGNEFGGFGSIDGERLLNDCAVSPCGLEPQGENGPLNEAQILARRIFNALGDDEFVVAERADDRLHWPPKHARRPDATVAKGCLIAARRGAVGAQ